MTALAQTFHEDLARFQDEHEKIPGAHAPSLRLASDLTDPRNAGNNLHVHNVSEILDALREQAVLERADYHASFIGDTDIARNKAKVKARFVEIAQEVKGAGGTIQDFAKRCNHLKSQVLTGHPTFSMHHELLLSLGELTAAIARGDEDVESHEQWVRESLKLSYTPPSLDEEEKQAHYSLDNIQGGISILEEAMIEAAQEGFPETWTEIDYMPYGAATWIPFDWDGRADIEWFKLLEKAIYLQEQLLNIQNRLLEIGNDLPDSASDVVRDLADRVFETHKSISQHRQRLIDYREQAAGDLDLSVLAGISREIIADVDQRITDPNDIIAPLQGLIDEGPSDEALTKLVHLRSRLKNHGLMKAGIHFRINAQSVMNAVAERERGHIPVISGQPQSFHLGDIARWSETVLKQQGIAAKFRQFFDEQGRIRYLIAECNDPRTVIETIKFAQSLGIDDKLEICPLFEDQESIQNARKTVQALLKDPIYIAHIKKTGVVPFQFGLSDSGRYINQIAASRYVERAQEMILKEYNAACRQDPDLKDLQIVFFPTGGNQPNRGEHPVSVDKAARYHHTPRIIARAKDFELKVKHETTGQGGDGNLKFATKEAAFADIVAQVMHLTADHSETSRTDPFYHALSGDAKAYADDVIEAHAAFSASQENAEFLANFTGFLVGSGSRPVKRAAVSGGARKLPRAIPDGFIKKQLGVLASVTYGHGHAIRKNPERFQILMSESPIFRETFEMVDYVIGNSDPEVLRSYVRLYDPHFWQNRAKLMKAGSDEERRCYAVARQLEKDDTYAIFSRFALKVIDDFAELKQARLGLDLPGVDFKRQDTQKQFNRQTVHGIRQASMIDLFERAIQLPEFPAGRHDFGSRDDLVFRIMGMDSSVLADVRQIFRDSGTKIGSFVDFGEESTWPEHGGSYHHLLGDLVDPMQEDFDQIHRVTETLCHMVPGTG